MKNTPSVLVSGLGMGMQLLQKLTDAIVLKKGYPEMLYSLCTLHPSADATIDRMAQLIVQSDWRVPRSLLERLATENSRSNGNDEEAIEHDRCWGWSSNIDLVSRFGIPVEKFSGDRSWCDAPPVPNEIVQQLVDKRIVRSISVLWKGEPHIIVDADVGWSSGKIFQASDFKGPYIMAIAPANRFDFEH